MRLPFWLGIVAAVLLHALVLLFGGIFFLDDEKNTATHQTVDLLSDLEAEAEEEKKAADQTPAEQTEEIAADDEEPPDSAEIMRELEQQPSLDSAPALEAASLSAIEAALNGHSGSGDFAESVSLASGGRIGGTGTGIAVESKVEEAFSLAELDQPPRAIHRESPSYPTELRGKKLEGDVTVLFEVDTEGRVTKARAGKSSHAAFEAPAVAAVKKWKFEPGIRNGERAAAKLSCLIRFPAN